MESGKWKVDSGVLEGRGGQGGCPTVLETQNVMKNVMKNVMNGRLFPVAGLARHRFLLVPVDFAIGIHLEAQGDQDGLFLLGGCIRQSMSHSPY